MRLTVKCNKRDFSELIKAIDYIKEDSPQNAEKVKEEILTNIDKLANYPDFFSIAS